MPQVCVLSINVSDMELAQQFYCDKLGFEVSKVYDPTIISLKHNGISLVLSKAERVTAVEYPAESQVVPGIQTDDIVKTMVSFRAMGVEFVYDTPLPCPPGLYNAFKDPFGNVFELIEFRED